MGKYFGTDGIRGRANDTLTLDKAIKIGRYLGTYYGQSGHARILIGKDTRLSSSMFESGLAAGAAASGADVYLLGVCPTPSVSYLIQKEHFSCGIMVSASHNPYYDNGIKLFSPAGKKMDPAVEEAIEATFTGEDELPYAINEAIGRIIDYHDALQLYISWLRETACDLSGMNIALDLANGSAVATAVETLRELGAKLEVIHSEPNGVNINTHCGSTHPEELQELMRKGHYDAGFAFDGDADRLIAVDEDGNLINGDYTLYIVGKALKAKGLLKDDVVVTTVMANLGLYKAFEKCGIHSVQTAVGDKYVYECMRNNDYRLGGEQSGHIIFSKYATTGDGILTSIKLMEVMLTSKKKMSELTSPVTIYPQCLKNVKVASKPEARADEDVQAIVAKVSEELGNDGRIILRESGTEPVIRVMVEAKTDALAEECVDRVIAVIKEKGHAV